MKTKKSVYILAFALLTLISCSNGLQESKKQKKNTFPSVDEKTYICLNKLNFNSARSVNPSASDYSVEDLTDIVLKGKKQGSDNEITFNDGTTWVEIMPLDGKITITGIPETSGEVNSGNKISVKNN